MSSAQAQVRFLSDGLVMFCTYNGTADVMVSHLFGTVEESDRNWRGGEWKYCDCGKDEPAELASDYGGGFHWRGKACRSCRAITDEGAPFNCGDDASVLTASYARGRPLWWVLAVAAKLEGEK